MLVSQRSRPRGREVTGPTPYSVALRARLPAAKSSDYLNMEMRRKDEIRAGALAYIRQNERECVKSKFEKITDHKILHNTVQRKVQDAMQQYKMGTEERRDRLRDMLENEERELIKEMESMEETALEKLAKMRERAKYLKEKREDERLALVAEKRDQQFREQCEELRSLLSQNHQREVCTERLVQLSIKEQLQKQQKEENDLFAQLWEKDRLMKEEREEQDAQSQKERDRGMLDVLHLQIAATEAQKMEEKRLKQEEAVIMAQQRALYRLDEERAQREKLQKQQQTRHMLDGNLRLKMKRLAREQQEELILDMKILEQLLKDTQDDTLEKKQRKEEMRKEELIYREYLANQLEEEKRQEKEMEKMIEAELEKSLAKRAEQTHLEREARYRLLREVMETRHLQICEKLSRNAGKQEELARDRELLEKAIEEHKQLELERTSRHKQLALEYQDQLLSQVAYQKLRKEMENEEECREFQAGLLAEKAYQEKLKTILARPYANQANVHPLRKSRISSPKDWLPA
ncbi:cilia- and flagella-associated protein 53 isoform X2 [Ambystoma mexicanum]|uniref:cilia- and flagella-associated protein 53 isoform X2 n=1 Tax=Ambystoma mexicanum TaxID=8296 RepID=UPI0037E8D759